MNPNRTTNTLEVRGLTVNYGNVEAVKNVDFIVPNQRIVGLVGESGSGKSTLISSVIGLLPEIARINSGEIIFGDRDLRSLSEEEFQRLRGLSISFIPQDPLSALNPVLTIGQHMTDIQFRDNINPSAKRDHALHALQTVHMPDPESRLDMYPHELSGGQKQRVSIAMAIMMKPKLLIADEPTTALDATLEVEIIALLKELQNVIGCSMVVVTHHLGLVSELCNDVVVMYKGEVHEAGLVEDVFNRPQSDYMRKLLRCDPSRISEKCRRLPTMEQPDLKVIEDSKQAKQRICSDEAPILEITDAEVIFQKPFSFKGLIKGRPRGIIKAVDKASIRLSRGETLAIVGESGSGKTTLARSILRLVKMQSGSVNFCGHSVLTADKKALRQLRSEIALVFQDSIGSLSPRMNVYEILREVLQRRVKPLQSNRQEIERLLQLVGLDSDFSLRYAHQLSGGQARRICLARALAQEPKLLIADEPTAGLDVSIQGEVLNLLAELQEKFQLPILIITHNLNIVRHVSDRVAIMYMGKIVEEGSTESIFSNPKHSYTKQLLAANLCTP
jgi:peptide/nickel transport system ATP-binding protein